MKQVDQYLLAVFAAGFAPLVYTTYSFWLKALVYPSVSMEVFGTFVLIFMMGALSGVVVLAWSAGVRWTVGFAVLVLGVSPFEGGASVGSGIPVHFQAVALVYLIGLEWMVRDRGEVIAYLNSRLGRLAVVAGTLHVVYGLMLQHYSRGYLPHLIFLVPPIVVGLLGLVLLPAYLWNRNRLMAPLLVIMIWIVWGGVANYLWWNTYPVSGFYVLGSVSFAAPAPDYAFKFFVPLMLVLLTSLVELALREHFFEERADKQGVTDSN